MLLGKVCDRNSKKSIPNNAWIVERGSELQDARRATEQELELSEGRRREAETELETREVVMERGLTH